MAMIIVKNTSAMFLASLLSMIFLALPARAFLTVSEDKTQNISGQAQDKNQPTPLNHQEQPRERQQTTQQDKGHQSSQKTQDTQETHEGRREHRDHDEDVKNQRPAQFFNYGNIIPVQYNPGTTSISTYVDHLPAGHFSVIINGMTYAVYQDVFYIQTPSGYQAVDPTTLIYDGSFSISIPNKKGGYIQIQIQVVENGFIGPQGEFYPRFPSIQQLQTIYVR
jgi:hypothetical protein